VKTCTKCGIKYPAILEYFSPDKRGKNGLQSRCRKCYRSYQKRYRQIKRGKIADKKYRSTFNGYLRCVFNGLKRRCNNPNCAAYKNYGGRGIRNKFNSFDSFRDYIINDLGHDTYEKIKGLQIDRTDNNGHYERGNIRFVTCKENCNNRAKRS